MELEEHKVNGVQSFLVGQVVKLLYKDDSEEVIEWRTILGLSCLASFYTKKMKKEYYSIDVFQAIDESAPLMEPNMDDDLLQIFLELVVGTNIV